MICAKSKKISRFQATRPAKGRCGSLSRRLLPAIVFICGLAITTAVFFLLTSQESRLAQAQFEVDAGQRVAKVEEVLRYRIEGLRLLASYYAGSEFVDSDEFLTFAKPMHESFTDTEFVAWAPIVTQDERQSNEESARARGISDYRIQTWNEAKRTFKTAPARPSYCPIEYVASQTKSSHLLGCDLRDQSKIRAAMDNLQRGEKVAAIFWRTPGSEENVDPALIFMMRATTEGKPSSVDPQKSKQDGFVIEAIRLRPLCDEIRRNLPLVGVDIFFYEDSDREKPTPIIASPSRLTKKTLKLPIEMPEESSGISCKMNLAVADKRWLAYCVPSEGYRRDPRTWHPAAAFWAGTAISLLAGCYLFVLIGRAERVEKLVLERTETLNEEQRFLKELLETQERERKLIAYEIHDGLAQYLTAASLQGQAALGALKENNPPRAQESAELTVSLVKRSIDEARRLIGGLRPPVLDESGLAAGIEYLIEKEQGDTAARIEFECDLKSERYSPPLESALYRITQECLTNACRYSKSPVIHIGLKENETQLHFIAQDWGVGFNPSAVGDSHFGLRGIRERVRLFGGKMSVTSSDGQGTTISIDLPTEAGRSA